MKHYRRGDGWSNQQSRYSGFLIQIVLLSVTQLHIGFSLTGQSKSKSINQSINTSTIFESLKHALIHDLSPSFPSIFIIKAFAY